MPGDYGILAQVYDTLGMGAFAASMTPRLIEHAHRNEWAGKRILDLGCGTGASWNWGEKGSRVSYYIVGVDEAPEMLAAAQQSMEAKGYPARWIAQDIRKPLQSDPVDMVLGLDVMNDLNTLNELETVFKNVQQVLPGGKPFIFDLRTIEGLTQDGTSGDRLLRDDKQKLTAMVRSDYDYERQMHTRSYVIFRRDGQGWARSDARQVLRGFPVQAVATLLQRSGFAVQHLLTPALELYDAGTSRAARVIFYAVRQ